MPTASFTHWAIVCHPAWGHVRHFNGFITRLLRRDRQKNFRITFLVHHTHARKARLEIAQLLDEEGESSHERERLIAKVRVIGLAPTQALLDSPEYQKLLLGSTTSIRFGMELQSSFGSLWTDVLTSNAAKRSARCAGTGTTYSYDHWPRPKVLHTDIYGAPIIRFIREQDVARDWHTEMIYHWSTEFISFWRMFKDDDISEGGIERIVKSLIDEGKADPDAFVELCWQRYNCNENRLLHYPGLKDGMYDYEIHPGQVGWLKSYIPALNRMKSAPVEADGVVIASCSQLQPEVAPLIRDWLATMKTQLYAIGPCVEDNLLCPSALPPVVHEKDAAIWSFLSRCEERFGRKSVVLLSWGTIWAPFRYPDILEAWLDELIASGRPFILNRSAELFSSLSPWIEEKLKAAVDADIGYQTTWIAQRTVLRHPAMGAFVSHCGYSSTCESTVPLIGWPSFFDQSINAQLQVDSDCGWQLYQVRGPDAASQGHKCRTLELRGEKILGTIEAVRQEARYVINASRPDHPEYLRKSANLERIKSNLLQSITHPSGAAYQAFERLVEL